MLSITMPLVMVTTQRVVIETRSLGALVGIQEELVWPLQKRATHEHRVAIQLQLVKGTLITTQLATKNRPSYTLTRIKITKEIRSS